MRRLFLLVLFLAASTASAGDFVTNAGATLPGPWTDSTTCNAADTTRFCAGQANTLRSGMFDLREPLLSAPIVTTGAWSSLGNEKVIPTCGGAQAITFNGTTFTCISVSVTTAFPTCAAGQYLTYNGSTFSCVADSGGSGSAPGGAAYVTTATDATLTNEKVVADCSSTGGFLTWNGTAFSCAGANVLSRLDAIEAALCALGGGGAPCAPPSITSCSPSSGPVGATVICSGSALTPTSSVTFNGTPATTFSSQSAAQVTAIVPAGATTGNIVITTAVAPSASWGPFTVTTGAPGQVTGLGASNVTATGLTLAWNAPSGSPTSYDVDWAPDSAGAPGTFTRVATPTATSVPLGNLVAGSRNWFRVRGVNGTGAGPYSTNLSVTMLQIVATPTFSPAAGSITTPTNVAISTTTSSATICYTTNGTNPAANTPGTCSTGSTYSGAISVSATTTIKALATRSGFQNSAIATATYNFNESTFGTQSIVTNPSSIVTTTIAATGGGSWALLPMPANGTVTKVRFWSEAADTARQVRGTVYGFGAGQTATLIAATPIVTGTPEGAWIETTFSTPVQLSGGTNYLFGVIADGAITTRYLPSQPFGQFFSGTNAGWLATPPASMVVDQSSNGRAVEVVYTTGGGGGGTGYQPQFVTNVTGGGTMPSPSTGVTANCTADGATDVTSCLQSAINSAASQGKPVLIPPASNYYRITSALNVTTSILGCASSGCTSSRPQIRMTNTCTTATCAGLRLAANMTGWIYNLRITGTFAGSSSGEQAHNISVGGVNGVTISGNLLENARGDNISDNAQENDGAAAARNVLVTNNLLNTPYRCNIALVNVSDRWVIINNESTKSNDYGSAYDWEPWREASHITNIELAYNKVTTLSSGAPHWMTSFFDTTPGGGIYSHHNYGSWPNATSQLICGSGGGPTTAFSQIDSFDPGCDGTGPTRDDAWSPYPNLNNATNVQGNSVP